MKIKHSRGTARHAAVSILILVLLIAAAGCGGSYSSGGGGGNAPYITAQPANQTVTVGQAATFSVTATGTAPLTYQWKKGGSMISGATSSSYTTSATVISDNGAQFTVVVTNSIGSVTSNPATLTVNSASAPTISSLSPTSGLVGTSVAITGANFGATQGMTSTVKFNGTTATTITGWSATSITAQVPAGATTGNVVVTVGGTASNGVMFTVLPSTSTSSWTFVQESIATACSAGSTTCTIDVANGNLLKTVAGSIWAVLLTTNNDVTITSVSGGGGTWNPCPSGSCHLFNSTLSRNVDAAYNLTGAGGTTSVTVTISPAAAGQFGVNFIELLPPPGTTASFDVAGTATTNSCTTCTGVGLPISGTDAIVQNMAAAGTSVWNPWSFPYISLPLGDGLNLNALNGAAPTVTTTGPGAVFSAIAFSAGSFSPPTLPMFVVNYTNPTNNNCNPSCSFSIPTTGAGHLLYVEAGDITTNFITSVTGAAANWTVPTGTNTCRISMSGGYALSCAYALSSSSSATSLSVTMTGNANVQFAVWEIASTSGTFFFDVQGSATNAASTNPAGVTLALTGTNDVIFQSIFVPGGTSAVQYYPYPRIDGCGTQFFCGQAGNAALLNTTNGIGPLWANEQNNATVVTGVAFNVQ